jgi:aspartate/methionine/tyrosine aminotransferase
MAGVRAGFFAGDAELVAYLRGVRQHAGLMVPGPVQAAAAVALADDDHVAAQRRRYHERLSFLAGQLAGLGYPTPLPQGGFYLWVKVPSRWPDEWAMTEHFARAGGLLVSPGELYGEAGRGYVRIAVVQPMVRLRLAVERLSSAGGA